jgi:hypothetical protein
MQANCHFLFKVQTQCRDFAPLELNTCMRVKAAENLIK